MRDIDIPNTVKVKNPGKEIFSLAGRINLPPGKITDVNLGALHDLHRHPTYLALLTSLIGGAIEFVSGPDGYELPPNVASEIARRVQVDTDGVADAKRREQALANRPNGTPTLPTVQPPGQVPVIPPSSNVVGSASGAEFVPPPPPTTQQRASAPPPPPAAAAAEAAVATAVHDQDSSDISSL